VHFITKFYYVTVYIVPYNILVLIAVQCSRSVPLASLRQDEIGTPYRIIADEGTLETGLVALQHRDTTIEVLQ